MEKMDLNKLRINNIIDDFVFMILKNPNIIGVGRGNKIINGHMMNKPTLTFFVKKKLYSSSVSKEYMIPQNIRGALTDVIEIGEFNKKRLSLYKNKIEDTMYLSGLDDDKPALGGGCLVLPDKPSKKYNSTLTYAVTDKDTRKNIYFLTSGHLWDGLDKKYLKFLQYSKSLTSSAKKSWPIGKLLKLADNKYDDKIKGLIIEVDAGIGMVGINNDTTRELIVPGLLNGKIITSIQAAKVGDSIYKYGISTQLTEGNVVAVKASIKSSTEGEKREGYDIFANQILTKQYIKDGDSGALGVIKETQKAFGMLNAGGDEFVSYSDIRSVLYKLNIELLI